MVQSLIARGLINEEELNQKIQEHQQKMPITNDLNGLGETVTMLLVNLDANAQTNTQLMQKVTELENRITELEGKVNA